MCKYYLVVLCVLGLLCSCASNQDGEKTTSDRLKICQSDLSSCDGRVDDLEETAREREQLIARQENNFGFIKRWKESFSQIDDDIRNAFEEAARI